VHGFSPRFTFYIKVKRKASLSFRSKNRSDMNFLEQLGSDREKGPCDRSLRMRRVGRPTLGDEPRKLIAIRLDPKVLGWLRRTAEKKGLPYQSLVNQILAEEMRKAS